MLGLVYGAAELISFGALHFCRKDASLADLRMMQQTLARTGSAPGDSPETIHPYLGWTWNPQTSTGAEHAGRRIPVNELGFVDDKPSIQKRGPDRLIIGLAGGSVAWQTSVAAEETLKAALRSDPRYADREIILIRLAMSGYKQPQQLLALTWLYSLGAEFDVVVNLDGFNEAVLPVCENATMDVSILYPRRWNQRTQDIVDPREFTTSYQLLRLRATRQELARDVLDSPLNWSPTRNLYWMLRDLWIQQCKIELASRRMNRHGQPDRRGFAASGPVTVYASDAELHAAVVRLWADGSRQMNRLCRANGSRYLHLLQPNQYLPGSKPLSELERTRFYTPNQDFARAIQAVYPLMITAGRELAEEGIDFVDLTRLFADEPDTVYSDWICHFNAKGSDRLAESLVRAILAAPGE